MKKVLSIGNCQANALLQILSQFPEFSENFTYKMVPGVFEITPEQVVLLHEELKATDILIIQPIVENYRNNLGVGTETCKALLPKESTVITWCSAFCNIYNPELFYMKNADGVYIVERFTYHNALIFRFFLEGKSVEETLTALQNPHMYTETLQDAMKNLAELERREKDLDVHLVPFIKENFRKEQLFWTMNHPSNALLLEAARQILALLVGKKKDEEWNFWEKLFSFYKKKSIHASSITLPEILKAYSYPILPGVYNSLGLEFPNQTAYTLGNKEVGIFQLVTEFFEFYRSHPDLVEINRHIAEY